MGEIININMRERKNWENKVPDEVLDLPNKVHDANWRDDIPEDGAEDETEEGTSFELEPYKDEQGYKSSEIVTPEAENLIMAFERTRLQNFGGKTLSVYRKAA